MTAGREDGAVGSTARRGPGFTLGESGPFPGSLPPNPACAVKRTRLSSDLCRVRDGFRVDEIMTCGADDKRFPSHFRHECRPCGLTCSRFSEFLETGDLVNCHRGPGLAELAFPCEEPSEQFLAGRGHPDGCRVADGRPPVLFQGDPAESCYQVLLSPSVLYDLEARSQPVTGLDLGLMTQCHLACFCQLCCLRFCEVDEGDCGRGSVADAVVAGSFDAVGVVPSAFDDAGVGALAPFVEVARGRDVGRDLFQGAAWLVRGGKPGRRPGGGRRGSCASA